MQRHRTDRRAGPGQDRRDSPSHPFGLRELSVVAPAEAVTMLQRTVGNARTGMVLRQKADPFKNAPDAKYWKRTEKWRKYRAREKNEPPPGPGSFEEPLDQKAMEALISAGGEKLEKAVLHYKLPSIDKIGAAETATDRALMDIRSGASKTREYLDYFNKAVDWVRITGKEIDLGPMVSNLRQVTGEMSKRLGQLQHVVDDVQDARKLLGAVGKFAGQMDGPINAGNVDQWIDAAEDLYNGLLPYAEKAKDAALTGALAGSRAAGQAFLLIGFVAFEIEAGLSLLKTGTKHIKRHQEVMQAYLDDPEEAERQRALRYEAAARSNDPPRPVMPSGWTSRENQIRSRKTLIREELLRRWQQQHDEDRRAVTRYFEAEVFPGVYRRRRPELKRRIAAAVKAFMRGGGGEVKPGEHFTETRPEFTWQEIVRDDHPSGRKIAEEIESFRRLSRERSGEQTFYLGASAPCPYFERIHDEALAKHLVKEGFGW